MLSIKPEFMRRLRAATTVAEVQSMVTAAYTLELATIPTYLTGAFSVKPGFNPEALALVQSVAYEEMLHLTLACNLLIAIGGTPAILDTGLSLEFPTPLPMCVDEGLTVALGAMTPEQVYTVFMGIEHPDTSAILPGEQTVSALMLQKQSQGYESIGDFYQAILDKLAELEVAGLAPFAQPNLDHQVDIRPWFPHVECGDGKVSDMETARAIVAVILAQGEGAQIGEDPIDPYGGFAGSFAHYFKFGEIYFGKRLVADAQAASGWSYSGASVALDPEGVYRFLPNATVSDYVPGTAVHTAAADFFNSYKRLLTSLDQVFNGAPEKLKSALAIMYELKLLAQKVVQFPAYPDQPAGYVAAPPFMLNKKPA